MQSESGSQFISLDAWADWRWGRHLFLGQLAAAGLLRLQVLVQEIQRLLVRLGATHDGEHTLTGLIMRGLGNRDPSSRAPADLSDLGSSPANDASNHVSGNADVLRLDLLAVLGDEGVTATRIGVGAAAVATGLVAEVGAVAGAVVRTAAVTIAGVAAAAAGVGHGSGGAGGGANGRVVEDGAGTALPVVDKALADLPDGLLDTLGRSLDLDDALGGLGEHFLLGDHANAGRILDVLDLEALSSDDGAHLVVRDQESHG